MDTQNAPQIEADVVERMVAEGHLREDATSAEVNEFLADPQKQELISRYKQPALVE